MYRPLTEVGKSQLAQQQALTAAKESGLRAIQFPLYPSIQATADDEEPKERLIELGPIATKYLRSMAGKVSTDKTFGSRDEDGKFYIGDSEVTISGDDVIVGSDTYDGTPGLWELLTSKNPDAEIYTINDLEHYKKILLRSEGCAGGGCTGGTKSLPPSAIPGA